MASQQAVEVIKLSGSTNGRPILVADTGTPGTLIHTATSTSGELDRIVLYACNTDASDHGFVLEFGGVTDPNDHISVGVLTARTGAVLIVDRLPIDGGVVIRAYGDATADINHITITGYVLRLTENLENA